MSIKNLFNKHSGPTTPLDQLVQGIQGSLNRNGSAFASPGVARAAMSLESMTNDIGMELDRSMQDLNVALESICKDHSKVLGQVSQVQKDAAIACGIMASDIRGFITAPISRSVVATENMAVIQAVGSDYSESRMREALEAYDEKDNKNAVVYSVAYNMQAARQDEFAEAFFPTVVVTPEQNGYVASIRLIQVYDEVRRQISGSLDQFNKRNIIQALIDPSILKIDLTEIVPVYRDESKDKFVAATLLTPVTMVKDGASVTTSALAVGKKLSLLGISQNEALLETGLQDTSDSIDTSIVLKNLFMTVGSGTDIEVVKFGTQAAPTAVFNYAVQGNYRMMNLSFTSDTLHVSQITTKADGSASAVLAPVVAGKYSVRLSVQVSGSVNCELGDTSIFASDVSVARVTDQDGNVLDMSTGVGKTIADLFAGAAIVGYDLEARRTNLNRRQRGQLLDTTYYSQLYTVPLRSPLTVPRPLTTGDANDSSDLAALITGTHIATTNAAIDEIFRAKDLLKQAVNNKDALGTQPNELLGVARFLVKPVYDEFDLDVEKVIDSLKSQDRANDMQAVLVNKLRDMVYRAYTNSGYKAAADALAGGQAPTPTVIIGTDPIIAGYLMVNGDFRTLGNEFNVKVVSTLNKRMSGKIVVSFGVLDGTTDGVPNPLHFGNMAWKPELTLVLPLHRNGGNSKELTVAPSFRHVANLPIMMWINVTNIDKVMQNKVAIATTP